MKYLIILIIASCCIGCAGSKKQYAGKGGPFIIEYHNNVEQEVILLSIRDSGIVVVSELQKSETNPFLRKAFFVSKDSIDILRHNGLSGLSTSGGILGGISGAIGLGGAAAAGNTSTESDIVTISTGTAFFYGAFLGGLAGSIIGSVAGISQSNFSLDDPDDKEKLIYLCKYCGHEPDFIHAIK